MTNDQYITLVDMWHFLGGISLRDLPYAQQLEVPQQRTALHKILCEGHESMAAAKKSRGL